MAVRFTFASIFFPLTKKLLLEPSAGEPRRPASAAILESISAPHLRWLTAESVAKKMDGGFNSTEMEYIRKHHHQDFVENQCASALVKHIRAPVPLVINQSINHLLLLLALLDQHFLNFLAIFLTFIAVSFSVFRL